MERNLKKNQMSSREFILEKIKLNQPSIVSDILPSLEIFQQRELNSKETLEKYRLVLKSIGGDFVDVPNYEAIIDFVKKNYDVSKRMITTVPELSEIAALDWFDNDSHTLENVELSIVKAHFGVAENAALWVTDDILGQRVSTFIPQYLALVVNKKDIVATMHQGYERIGNQEYGFGTFIAGPSKTADIEQSLVLGAHGARGLIVFIM
jgi:L-lactate dehydrogenase complex protein LldG